MASQEGNVRIRACTEQDLRQVAQLHRRALPDDFRTKLGDYYLYRTYYPHVHKHGLVSMIAETGNDLIGFVFFGSSNTSRTPISFLFSTLIAIVVSLRSKKNIVAFFDVVNFLLRSKKLKRGCELQYICVDARYRGLGLGKQLVGKALLALAKKPQADEVFVKTLAITPQNVKFYRNLGFKICWEIEGRVILKKKLLESSED